MVQLRMVANSFNGSAKDGKQKNAVIPKKKIRAY